MHKMFFCEECFLKSLGRWFLLRGCWIIIAITIFANYLCNTNNILSHSTISREIIIRVDRKTHLGPQQCIIQHVCFPWRIVFTKIIEWQHGHWTNIRVYILALDPRSQQDALRMYFAKKKNAWDRNLDSNSSRFFHQFLWL